MLDTKMKELCRICARELCGNQRRWIFHTASRLNLQVILSHVLGREISRDGRAEFACSKCVFMLDRIYRFDTVIARIEALSIERLQKLLNEKDRLKQCIANLYQRNNVEPTQDGTVDVSYLPDMHYSALLQEDFTYSGLESWVEEDEQGAETLSCHHFIDSGSQKPRRCRTCAALRVPDADYEAVCKIPRKLARSASCASRYSASTVGSVFSEDTPGMAAGSEQLSACLPNAKDKDSGSDGGVEKMSPIMSNESLDKAVETSPSSIREEEESEILAVEDEDTVPTNQVDADRDIKQDQKSDTCSDDPATINASVYSSKLELALTMVKTFDLRPVKSPKGSKLPILERFGTVASKSDSIFASEVSQDDTSGSMLNSGTELVSKRLASFHPELADLEELWEDVCEDFIPLHFRLRQKNLVEEQQLQLNQYETAAGQCMTELQKAEQQVHLLQSKIQETEASNMILQEKLSEMELEMKSVRQDSRKQDRSIQGLSEALASKQKEIEELYGVIEGQSESMDKLREIIQRGSLSQLQGPAGPLSLCLPLPQQSEFQDQQNSLLASHLELQKTRRMLCHRDYQLADVQRTQGLLEVELQEMRQQQSDMLMHGQELRGMLQRTRAELQEKELLLRAAEREKLSEIEDREKAILHLNQNLREKEHLIQECEGLFQSHQTSEGSMEGRDALLDKLRERIRDRDRALERAIDEKYCALEEKERETRKLQLALREKERDLERLRCVLSNNEETIHSLDGLVKVKDLELEQASLALQNLQRLKQDSDERHEQTLQEKDHVIAQLHDLLQAKNMEVENMTAALINRVSLGANEVAQQLRISLLEKEKILGKVLEEGRKQMAEHECEIHDLLAIVSSRDQQLKDSSERLVQLIAEKYHEVQGLRRQLMEREKEVTDLIKSKNPSSPGLMTETCRLKRLLEEKERFIDELMQEGPVTQVVPERMTNGRGTEGPESYEAAEKTSELQRELDNVKEELQFTLRKEKEARLELSNLQSVIDEQSKEIQLQTANIEALGKNQKAQQDLIKELQVRVSKPEELQLVEHLTQEVLALKEKAAQVASSTLDDADIQHQQSVLEILVSEQARLNDALETEMQLYNSLVKFHANPDSNERDRKLQDGLDIIRALQSQLEDGLRRSQMSLSRLDGNQGNLVNFGELGIEDEEEEGDEEEDDRSSQFTDSIEEDALSKMRLCKEAKQQVSFNLGQKTHLEDMENSYQSPGALDSTEDLRRQLLELEAEFQMVQEQKDRAEGELQKIKAQIEESGFTSLAQIRSTLLSLHLENAELKERVGDVGVGQWEKEEDEKEEVEDLSEEDLREEFRNLKRKQENAEMVIGLLKEQLELNLSVNGEKRFNSELIVNMAKEIQHLRSDLSSVYGKRSAPVVQLRQGKAKRQCTRPHSLDLGVLLSGSNSKPGATQPSTDGESQSQGFWQHVESGLREQLQTLRLELAQCRQQKQELQDKLMVTEATVQAQGSQLKQYRRMLIEPSVEQDNKQVQVDLQDLGYETCGRSENEAEREEVSSPECAEAELHGDLENDHSIFELNSQYDFPDAAVTSSPWPLKSSMKRQHQLEEYGKIEDTAVLQQHIQDLKTQLKNSEKVIRNLQARIRSFSTTSDYASSMERPSKIMKNSTFQASPSPSIADDDEGWQSDSFGDMPSLKIKPSKELAELVARVASLEAQLKKSRLEQSIPEQLRSATWPGKYDSLVQAQARELSHIRQKSREGRGLCHILTQHLQDTTKAFEELLRANDIDYYMGQSFRDQLAQGSQLVERISGKLSSRDRTNIDDKAGHELVALRLSRELQQKDKVIESLRAKLQEHFETSSSLALSESDQSERTSFVSDDRGSTNDELELCSNVDSTNGYTQSERRGRESIVQDHEGVGQPAPTGMKLMSGSAGLSTDSCNSSQTDFSHRVGSGPLPHLSFLQPQFNSSFSSDGMPKMDSGFLDSTGLWDMAHLVQPPRMNVFGDKSSGSSAYQSGASLSGTDLLEEHLGEIRNLRQRLEESIRTNDRLREQLEERLASAIRGNGPPTNIYIQGLESVSQLSNENRVLLEEKMNLQTQLSQLSRGHSAELEQLRESLISAQSKMKNLETELEKWQEENRRLQIKVREKQQEIVQLRDERQHCQEKTNRLQHEVSLLQQQMAENRQLVCSLQTEVHLYERLCGVTKPTTPAYLRDGELHGVSSTFDLKSLLSEVRSLRLQLEHSIQLNNSLRQQLEQQLTGNAVNQEQHPSSISIFPTSELGSRKEVYQDSVPSPPVRDTGPFSSAFPACSSSTPSLAELAMEDSLLHTRMGNSAKDPVTLNSSKLEGDAPDGTFASKNGRHVIGHIDDYTALQQQVMEGKVLVHKVETLMQSALNIPFLEIHGTKGLDYGKIKQLFANTNTLEQILKEISSLLKMFWRAALPSTNSPTQQLKKEQTMKEEIHTLRHKLAEKESLLQNATERLSATNQVKESMEQFIVGQLTRTHDVLKKARTNLEVKKSQEMVQNRLVT